MSTKELLNKTWEEDPKALLVVLVLGIAIGLFIMYLIINDTRRVPIPNIELPERSHLSLFVTKLNKDGTSEITILDETGKSGTVVESLPNNGKLFGFPQTITSTNFMGSWCQCWTQNGKTTCVPNAQHCR
jgi:hypothetical protein